MTKLLAEALNSDPRVKEAKNLLLQAVKDHQNQLRGIQAANPDLQSKYQATLDSFGENRGGKLFFPYLGSGIGKGCLVELADGSVKYDMICGIGPHYWGHSHPAIISAEVDACMSDVVMQGHLQQNTEAADLCRILVEASGMEHCFLSTTGVMANENALKMAFHKKPGSTRVLAFERCFAGRTLALSQVTDKPGYRKGLPSNLCVDYIPFFDETDPIGSQERAVTRLKEHLYRYPGEHSAMILELVQGEAGFYPGNRDFFIAIMDVLKDHEVAIIDDEVQAFGRTPSLFAYQHFGLEDYIDIVTIGKLSQVCATIYKANFKPGPGLLSQTFIASTSALRAAKVIITGLLEGNYLGESGKIMQMHRYITSKLEEVAKRHPGLLSGPFGIGTMVAFTPLDGSNETTMKCLRKLYDNGVIAFVAGTAPARIRFLVPIGAITKEDVDSVVEVVEQTLLECASVPA